MIPSRIFLLLIGFASVAFVGFVVYRRIDADPIAFLMAVIGAAAAIVVILQILKDW